jgi:subfamily B ATP-binding cassette protein MsbA/ATP-binding cassette subfamily B protein AbcA/BmrA
MKKPWRLISFSGRYFVFFAVSVLSSVAFSVTNVLTGDTLAKLIDQIIGQNQKGLIQAGIRTMWVLFASVLSVFFQRYFSGQYAERITARLREQTSRSVVHADVFSLDRFHSGEMLSRLSNDIALYQEYLQTDLPNLISGVLSAVLALVYMFYHNWLLSLLLVATLPVILGVSVIFSAPVTKRSEEVQKALAHINEQAKENVTGAETIRSMNLKTILLERFKPVENHWFRSSLRLGRQSVLLTVVGILLSFSPFIVVFGFGGLQVIRGEITVGVLFAFVQLLNLVAFPLQELPVYLGKVKSGIVGGKRVRELLTMNRETETGKEGSVETHPQIAFDHVNFTYPGQDNTCLKDISFAINPGEKVAFVGASGSGKSTLLKLIAGDYYPDKGTVRIGSLSTNEWALTGMRNSMGIVTQESFLFDISIAENIRIGSRKATEENIRRVLSLSEMDTFVESLPAKTGTAVGELGGKMSGGQKQRLCISRSLIREAPILVFDEATSALDNETEQTILTTIRSKYPKTTLLMVAHRLNAIAFADRIFVLEAGKIVEEGTHLSLMHRNGKYAELIRMQQEGDLA